MNPLEPIAHFIDPVARYFRRTDRSFEVAPDLETLDGRWVTIEGWQDEPGLQEAAQELVRSGAVQVRTPHAVIAAQVHRFWTGSGVLDTSRFRDEVHGGRSVTRIERRRMANLHRFVLNELRMEVGYLDPDAPEPD